MNLRAFTSARNLMRPVLTFQSWQTEMKGPEDFNRGTIPIKLAFTA